MYTFIKIMTFEYSSNNNNKIIIKEEELVSLEILFCGCVHSRFHAAGRKNYTTAMKVVVCSCLCLFTNTCTLKSI